MIRVGITGKSGFIGTHLSNNISLKKDKYDLINFEDSYFQDHEKLAGFANSCDYIVHLAALNRHSQPDEILRINIILIENLLKALDKCSKKPHIIFSSSTQENRNNAYGVSKIKGRLLFEEWAKKNNSSFTGLIIPNVFGPFGLPFYNSFISTFSYQLTHNETPEIEIDAEIEFIYVDELVNHIINIFNAGQSGIEAVKIPSTERAKVTEVLKILEEFKDQYFDKGIIPDLSTTFRINLFNTFRSYIDLDEYFPFSYKVNQDNRGIFVETMKLNTGGQVSFSTTKPGITRGNHLHTRKIERFAVLKGEALIKMRKINTSEVLEFKLNGNKPSFVDMPVWYTHNITNTGTEELITMFWINEFYDENDADTYFETV
ncbi:MAG: NAD-dependent epimerase/dehydratase family protein [Ignavibacteriaceae bacterium]|jgi:UDP-2-acetamido-2,6-beta-L-arabino-hexul-4-ose reductase|nr:NAD-dependent epimerase/dehydratase family protein [Ignavibacteriaceae bacterium]